MHRQAPSVHLTKKNPIVDIPYQQRRMLCAQLDIKDDWKKFVGFIRSRDGMTPRYSDIQVCLFEKEKYGRHGSPTDALLKDWRTLRPTIGDFLELLISVELLEAANYINSVVLGDGPIKQPVQIDECKYNWNNWPHIKAMCAITTHFLDSKLFMLLPRDPILWSFNTHLICWVLLLCFWELLLASRSCNHNWFFLLLVHHIFRWL